MIAMVSQSASDMRSDGRSLNEYHSIGTIIELVSQLDIESVGSLVNYLTT
jgi:hypothetical protein